VAARQPLGLCWSGARIGTARSSWQRLFFPLLLLPLRAAAWRYEIALVEPLQCGLMSLLAGREDSSNISAQRPGWRSCSMIAGPPWAGIGPGTTPSPEYYPLYNNPSSMPLSAYFILPGTGRRGGAAGLAAPDLALF